MQVFLLILLIMSNWNTVSLLKRILLRRAKKPRHLRPKKF